MAEPFFEQREGVTTPPLLTCYHASGTSHGSHETRRAAPAAEEGCCLGKTVMGSGGVDENAVKILLL